MIITITELTQEFTKSGAEYVKAKGVTQDGQESTKSIFNNLKDSWPLLEVGATLDFTMEKKGQFWNVTAINPAGEKPAIKPSIKPAVPPVAKTTDSQRTNAEIKQPLTFINPQEKGMWWKEVGENFRAGLLKKDNPAGKYLWQQYIKQMLASLEINIPKEEVKTEQKPSPLVEAAKKMGATEIKPEELPF